MTDPFTSLRRSEQRVEPDPEFRNELLLAVRQRLDRDAHAAPASPSAPISVSLEDYVMEPTRPRNRRLIYAAAAIAVIGGLTVFAIVRADDDSQTVPPVAPAPATATTAPATTTTAPATTTTLPPLSDAEIAHDILLQASEYAPDWRIQEATTASPELLIDEQVARLISSCAPFYDSVFGATKAATAMNRTFYHPPPTEALFGQFVLVFPEEAQAKAMVDAMADPAFEACQADYLATGKPVPEGWYGWGHVANRAPRGTADQVIFSTYEQTWTNPVTGETIGPEENYGVVVRVGRTVTLTGTLHLGDSGTGPNVEVVSPDQFGLLIDKVAERATAALQGTPLPAS